MKLTDWRGNEYGPGDRVLYAAMSGRSAMMVEAMVLDIYYVGRNEKYEWERLPDGLSEDELPSDHQLRVQVEPHLTSRWKQHHGRTWHVDTRTGKRIDPYRSEKHWKSGGYNACKTTGARLDQLGCALDGCPLGPRRDGYHGFNDYEHVPLEFHDYVKRMTEETKRVTLTVTENITKI